MKKLLFSFILTSQICASFQPTVKVEFPDTIKVQPDFSNISENAGSVTKDIVKEVIISSIEGFSEASKNKQLGKNMTEGFKGASQQAAGAFADAAGDPQLRSETARGAHELTKTMGIGAEQFSQGLKYQVFPHIEDTFRDFITSFSNVENAIRFGGPIALGGAIALTGFYGTKVFWNVLEKKLLNPKPAIVLPGSKYGRTDRLKRWWKKYQTPPMIFDASVKERLEEIEEKTKNIRAHILSGKKITYDNLLLYGKPGTGKTLFAQILADKTDMDFLPVTAASLLQVGVEGIKYFDELLDMANRSKYGVIIFVDEADALFVNRDNLSPESDHYKVLNHILAITGNGSNKFMLIAATNHAYVMDPAMGRRFQDRVEMPLPDKSTRQELLNLYINQTLFNTQLNSKDSITVAKAILTTQRIIAIAEQTAGLSHAEIKDMVAIMGKKANATKDGILTERNVQSAVAEAVEKMKALEKDKKELEAKKRNSAPAGTE